VASGAVLLDQPDLAKTHQVRVGAARWHARGAGQIAQGHGPTLRGQGPQQSTADLNGLYAPALFFVFSNHVYPLLVHKKLNSNFEQLSNHRGWG
jgi:hypothetical protein